MRIALDARPLTGQTGARGVGRYVRELIRGLIAADPNLELVALVDRGAPLDRPHDAVPLGGTVESRPISAPPGPQLLWGALLGPSWLRATRAEVWHSTFLAPPRVPRSMPWVATIHDLIPLRHPERFSFKTRFVFERSLTIAARANRVVCVSEFTARCAVERFGIPPARVAVIPPPIDIDAFGHGAERGIGSIPGPYLLHLGGFDPLKGFTSRLLPAFAELASRDRELVLACTGGPSAWRDAAQRAVIERGLQARVTFLGTLLDQAHACAVRGAKAVVVSSHEEGFGIPVIEALAAGVPLAIGNANASREAAGGLAFLAADDSPSALADAIRESLAAPGIDSPEAALRRAHAARFHPKAIGARMLALYRELIGSAA